MAAKTASRGPQTIPVDISGGEHAGGDASIIPPNAVRRMRNLVWEDTWTSRPPFTYDNLTGVRGLAMWYDDSSLARRLIAFNSSTNINVKAASGETYSTVGTVAASRLVLDQVSFRGVMYAATGASAGSPSHFYAHGGAATVTSVDLASSTGLSTGTVLPYSLATYGQRLFFGGATRRHSRPVA